MQEMRQKLEYILKEVAPDCGSVNCKYRHKSKEISYSQLKYELCTCYMPEDSRENHLQSALFAKMMKDWSEEYISLTP